MNQPELRGDLKAIEDALTRAGDVPAVKRVVADLIEWNRSFVDQTAEVAMVVQGLDEAVDELLEGSDEVISVESFKVIATALEQSRLVCVSVMALVDGGKGLDEVTAKRLRDLVKPCERSIAIALQTAQELVVEDKDEPTTAAGMVGEEVEGGEGEGEDDDELDDADGEEADRG